MLRTGYDETVLLARCGRRVPLQCLALRDLKREHLPVLRGMANRYELDLVRIEVQQLFDEVAYVLNAVVRGVVGRV